MSELLIELFSEEIPARMQLKAASDLENLFTLGLKDAGLAFASVEHFVTPRRLTLRLTDVASETPSRSEERRGPRADAPQQAIAGFLSGVGLAREDLEERETPKGTFLYAVINQAGRSAASVVAEVLADVIAKFPWPKSQRWGTSSLRWVRPLKSVICLLGGEVVSFELDGVPVGRSTQGHRFMSEGRFDVADFADYRAKLLDAKVMLDHGERCALIRARTNEIAASAGLEWIEDAGLLSEVAGLVEWPVPMLASFDPAFLEVPEEVLVLTMKQDQKCFMLRGKATGKLAPNFIFVANLEPADGGATVVRGNERVVTARLSDARFFWQQDLKTTLEARLPQLGEIVFHKTLGLLSERVERLGTLAGYLADFVPGADSAQVTEAARLSKADLVSSMVYEFPEVQGTMGRYYALKEGRSAEVANAIAEHYAPLGPNDDCPTAPVSVVLALAEKLDTLAGFFGIGQLPTGSKDPYALRRAALGVIRLITENGIRLSLSAAFDAASEAYEGKIGGATDTLMTFFADRLKVTFREKGVRHDLIDAVFAKGDDDLVRILARVTALSALLDSDAGKNLLAGYKRAANILRAEEKKEGGAAASAVDASLLSAPAEKALYAALSEARSVSDEALEEEDYEGAMRALAGLREPIDAFFEDVTVNDDDPAVRANRLAILSAVRDCVEQSADFSHIEG